jgi:hypothetical protein
VTAGIAAQEATGIGLQIGSNGSAAVVYRGSAVEAGVTAQATLFDTEAEGATPGVLRLGAHGAYLFGDPAAPRRFGIGAEFGTGLGTDDVQYDEYIDVGPRVSLDQMIGSRAYVSGLVYPFWIETRDVADVDDDWTLTARFPLARIAVTFLF